MNFKTLSNSCSPVHQNSVGKPLSLATLLNHLPSPPEWSLPLHIAIQTPSNNDATLVVQAHNVPPFLMRSRDSFSRLQTEYISLGTSVTYDSSKRCSSSALIIQITSLSSPHSERLLARNMVHFHNLRPVVAVCSAEYPLLRIRCKCQNSIVTVVSLLCLQSHQQNKSNLYETHQTK